MDAHTATQTHTPLLLWLINKPQEWEWRWKGGGSHLSTMKSFCHFAAAECYLLDHVPREWNYHGIILHEMMLVEFWNDDRMLLLHEMCFWGLRREWSYCSVSLFRAPGIKHTVEGFWTILDIHTDIILDTSLDNHVIVFWALWLMLVASVQSLAC